MVNDNEKSGLEIRFEPAEYVYVYENHGAGGVGRDLISAVVHNIAIVNMTAETITIDHAVLQVKKADAVVQSHTITLDQLKHASQQFHRYQEQGVLDAYDFQFRTKGYLQDCTYAKDLELNPGDALVVTRKSLLFQGLPDAISVLVQGHNVQGDVISTHNILRVVNHISKNVYHFPVKGRWMVVGAPSFHSHHRWATLEEFALDLTIISTDGLTHNGAGTKLSEFFSWGAPIYAMAAGTVVSVRGNIEESDNNLQQPAESLEEYFHRMLTSQQELLARGFEYTLGNHIIILHEHNEYSRYVHLQHGSVCVQVGDQIVKGQHIANLGHSGNSTEPHLHFDLADGPDFAYSRSIPMTFENITLYPDDDGSVRHLHSGQIVITRD